MQNKSRCFFLTLSAALLLASACFWQSMAAAGTNRNHSSKSQVHSVKKQAQRELDRLAEMPVDQGLDTLFAEAKADFDKMASSPILKSPKLKSVNDLFWKSLKAHQPWHSLVRTDKKGAVINEVIRIEGVSTEKRSIADQAWFAQIAKTMKDHASIVKIEKTGRYYLVWAAPIVTKVKESETFSGAVMAQIDLWDCFDRYSDRATKPFMIRILDRVVLYQHSWKDTLKYAESHLTVPGIDKIAVRYPKPEIEATSSRAADSAALEQARLDSMRIKAAADSAAKAALVKKAKPHHGALIAVIVVAALIVIILLVVVARSRKRTDGTTAGEGRDRFDIT